MGQVNLENVIRRPVITEKAAMAQQESNSHVFEVNGAATKIQIKDAVQKMFNVKVRSVRTLVMPRKAKRYGRYIGMKSPWKKAVVTLAAGQVIEALEPKA